MAAPTASVGILAETNRSIIDHRNVLNPMTCPQDSIEAHPQRDRPNQLASASAIAQPPSINLLATPWLGYPPVAEPIQRQKLPTRL